MRVSDLAILTEPMRCGDFRLFPLKVSDEEAREFTTSVLNIQVDLINKELDINFCQKQSQAAFDVAWALATVSETNFQLDAYTSRNQSIFSIIFLDCEPKEHNFCLHYDSLDNSCNHQIALKYREHVRFGPNGEMSHTKQDRSDDKDKVLAKLLFRHPKDYLF
jgi:hypothetical protein